MCDNMPFPKSDVTCPYCWWRGKRHERWQERKHPAKCPRCGLTVSDGWIFRTVKALAGEK